MIDEGNLAGSSKKIGNVLEGPRRLSESLLWDVMAAYYERSGIGAWASGDVPHLLTTGPMMAHAYAEVIEGFLSDCAGGRFGPIDLSEPVYVIELGAGTGRLAWNILRLLEPGSSGPLRVVYVLTDKSEANIEFWRSSKRLGSLVEAGLLEVAHYDPVAGGPISIRERGIDLVPGGMANPVAFVANYFFDVLAQDLYVASNEGLFEELVAVVVDDEGIDRGSPDLLSHVWLATRTEPVASRCYNDVLLDELLFDTAKDRGAISPERFLFPQAGLKVLARLDELAGGRMLLLSGERPGAVAQLEPEAGSDDTPLVDGSSSAEGSDAKDQRVTEAVRPGELLAMGVHGGSFSLPVDQRIIASFVDRFSGTLLMPRATPAGLVVTAIITGDAGAGLATRHRYAMAFDEGSPEDLFLALRALRNTSAELSIAMILVLIRVSGYDAHVFGQFYMRIQDLLREADLETVDEAVSVFHEVCNRYFPIDARTDVAFGAAGLMASVGRHMDALSFLQRSREEHGPTPIGSFNAAGCLLQLGRSDEALDMVLEALQLDPDLEQAKALRDQLVEELNS